MLLGVHKSAANNVVRADLGLFSLAIFCLKSCINFWLHVLELNSKLVYIAYRDNYSSDTGFSNKLQLFLDKINFSHVLVNKVTFSKARLLNAVMLELKDSYISFWRKCLFDDRKNAIIGK